MRPFAQQQQYGAKVGGLRQQRQAALRAVACDYGKGVFQRVARDGCAVWMGLVWQGKQRCRALHGERLRVLPQVAQGVESVFNGLDGGFPCVFAGRVVGELLPDLV